MASMPPLHLCHLIDHFGPSSAGAVVRDLVAGAGEGIAPSVIVLGDRGNPEAAERLSALGVPHHCLGISKLNPFAALRLRSFLRRAAPDMVHAHLGPGTAIPLSLGLPSGAAGPAVICQYHGDPRQQGSALGRLAARRLAPRVEVQIVPGPGLVQAAQDVLSGRARRIEAILPGIDPARLTEQPADAGRVWQLRGGAERVVGAVVPHLTREAVMPLLEAMPLLLAFEPSTQLLVIGEGPDRKALAAACKALGIFHNVDFFGELAHAAEAYGAMDVLALPSAYDGFARVLAEAMALGVPVVAGRVDGVTDLVADGETGLLVPFGDYGALATAILRLFSDPPLGNALRAEAKRVAAEKFSLARMLAETEALYGDLV